MTLHDFIRSKYTAPWIDPRSLTGPIHIDDQNEYDTLEGFCRMSVEFYRPDSNEFSLTITNVPWDELVEKVAGQLGGRWSQLPTGRCLALTMNIKSVVKMRALSEAIRKVTGQGRRYANCNWKWITGRASTSLSEFADLLMNYRTLKAVGSRKPKE